MQEEHTTLKQDYTRLSNVEKEAQEMVDEAKQVLTQNIRLQVRLVESERESTKLRRQIEVLTQNLKQMAKSRYVIQSHSAEISQ